MRSWPGASVPRKNSDTADKSLSDVYAASQWRLMWRKFLRNKAALGGGAVILVFYLVALFADFISPYGLTTRFRLYIYMPPQPVHWLDEGRFQPYVNDVKLVIDENLRKNYTPDLDKKIPLQFFVKGEPYKLFGFIPADVHLFLASRKDPYPSWAPTGRGATCSRAFCSAARFP